MMRTARGFTLMELLIALVLLGILLGAAIPSFRTFLQNNRLDSVANELVAATNLARSEAIERGQVVAVCASDDGAACGGSFANGWVVVADPDGDAELIRTWPSPGDDFQFAPAGGRVDFLATGFADLGAAVQLSLRLPECAGRTARRIDVQPSGRAAAERVACN